MCEYQSVIAAYSGKLQCNISAKLQFSFVVTIYIRYK